MKTILYQPIFINPQAYFVFPSLYHIEKGDSFIEPANITGQLIINTLTDDPTLTPIILTVKDNNSVDVYTKSQTDTAINNATNNKVTSTSVNSIQIVDAIPEADSQVTGVLYIKLSTAA